MRIKNWQIEISVMALMMLGVVGLAGCVPGDPNAAPRQSEIRKTFEVDGCQVKYIDPPGTPNFYIARCGNTTTTTWQQSSGKSTTTYGAIQVESADELRNRLASIEAREKALNKLSAEEKKVLGLQ